MSSINTLINGKIISIGAYMITLQDIQEKLAEAIKQSGMTQTNIGQLLNIRQQTVSHYVKGDTIVIGGDTASVDKFIDKLAMM